MTNEEMQKAMDFILSQQAQLTATVSRLSEKVDRNADAASALLAVTEIQSQEIRELGEAVRAVDERTRRTDERLDALINTVERYISEGRNGKG